MSKSNQLILEQQFEITKVSGMIDNLSHDQLKQFAKELHHHHVCHVSITQQILKNTLLGEFSHGGKCG